MISANVNVSILSNNAYSLSEISANPAIFPHAPQHSHRKPAGTVLDGTGIRGGFFETFADIAFQNGFDVVIVIVRGDVTRAGFSANWGWLSMSRCKSIPIYIAASTDVILTQATLLSISDQIISETSFIETPEFWIAFANPTAVLGFPFIRNAGSQICCLGLLLSISCCGMLGKYCAIS